MQPQPPAAAAQKRPRFFYDPATVCRLYHPLRAPVPDDPPLICALCTQPLDNITAAPDPDAHLYCPYCSDAFCAPCIATCQRAVGFHHELAHHALRDYYLANQPDARRAMRHSNPNNIPHSTDSRLARIAHVYDEFFSTHTHRTRIGRTVDAARTAHTAAKQNLVNARADFARATACLKSALQATKHAQAIAIYPPTEL